MADVNAQKQKEMGDVVFILCTGQFLGEGSNKIIEIAKTR